MNGNILNNICFESSSSSKYKEKMNWRNGCLEEENRRKRGMNEEV